MDTRMLSSFELSYRGKKRIVVISPNLAHPRYHRRVEALIAAGYQVTVYSFMRSYYNCNSFPPECELINLGQIKDGHYLERIPKLLNAARKIIIHEHRRKRANLLYSFEFDSAILGLIAVKTTAGIVYEVGDLRNLATNKSVLGRLLQFIENIILQHCSLVVNTSKAFLDFHFGVNHPGLIDKTLIIENKLPESYAKSNARPILKPSCYPLKIGYIGLLRYESTFNPLLNTIVKHKDRYSLHIFGDGPLRALAEQSAGQHDNIFYYGPFQNPEDLATIYNSIDVCYVVYDNNDINVRLALPNKLYESIFFSVPILVASETALFDNVKDWNVGWAVDPRENDFLDKFFNCLSLDDLDFKKKNASMINQDCLIENYANLHERIRLLIDRPS